VEKCFTSLKLMTRKINIFPKDDIPDEFYPPTIIWNNFSIHVLYDFFGTLYPYEEGRKILNQYLAYDFPENQKCDALEADTILPDPHHPWFIGYYILTPAVTIASLYTNLFRVESKTEPNDSSLMKLRIMVKRTVAMHIMEAFMKFGFVPYQKGDDDETLKFVIEAQREEIVKLEHKNQDYNHIQLIGRTQMAVLLMCEKWRAAVDTGTSDIFCICIFVILK
jgi:hypothetical protein